MRGLFPAIDRFILARLEEAKLAPAPEADKTSLIRRAYFDLIGLPPSPAEVAAFVDDDFSGCVCAGGRSAAGIASLRRAVGAILARRRALRRGPGPLVPAAACIPTDTGIATGWCGP